MSNYNWSQYLHPTISWNKFDITSLKSSVCDFVDNCNLPFSNVRKPTFQRLLAPQSPHVTRMLFKQTAAANHMHKLYYHYKEHIKKIYFGPSKAIKITQDAWILPKENIVLTSLTDHFINSNWEIMYLTLVIAKIQGYLFHDESNQLKLTDAIFQVHMMQTTVLV